MVHDDAALVGGVTKVGIQDWAIPFDDVGNVVDWSHSKRVVARANLSLAVVGGTVGKQPRDAEEHGKKRKPRDDRHGGPGKRGAKSFEHATQCASTRVMGVAKVVSSFAFRYPRGYIGVVERIV